MLVVKTYSELRLLWYSGAVPKNSEFNLKLV